MCLIFLTKVIKGTSLSTPPPKKVSTLNVHVVMFSIQLFLVLETGGYSVSGINYLIPKHGF